VPVARLRRGATTEEVERNRAKWDAEANALNDERFAGGALATARPPQTG
jgi:hypothetical protein